MFKLLFICISFLLINGCTATDDNYPIGKPIYSVIGKNSKPETMPLDTGGKLYYFESERYPTRGYWFDDCTLSSPKNCIGPVFYSGMSGEIIRTRYYVDSKGIIYDYITDIETLPPYKPFSE